MNAILQIVQQTITLVSLVALLIGFSPWLAVVVILAAIPNFISRSRFSEMAFRALTRRAPESRLLNYIETLLTSNETVKEIKLFGLGEPLLARYRQLFTAFFEEDLEISRKNTFASFGWGLLSNLAYYGSYIWVILRALAKAITLGDMTMFLSVFRQSQSAVQQLLDSFNRLYESNLYLDNLLDYLKIEPCWLCRRMAKLRQPRSRRASNSGMFLSNTPVPRKWCCKTLTSSSRPGRALPWWA